jgi:hypothetical protein
VTDQTIELPYDILTASPEIQQRYTQLVTEGSTPRMAEMLALRTAPRGMTDSVYFAAHGNLAKQFENAPCGQLECLVAVAKSRGYTPGMNDVYDPNLATEGFGDPLAFIPATGGRNHIKRVAEHRDHDLLDGSPVKNKRQRHGDTLDEKPIRLAPDLAAEAVQHMLHENPDLRFKADPRELLAEATARHGYDDSKLTGELSSDVHHPSMQLQ